MELKKLLKIKQEKKKKKPRFQRTELKKKKKLKDKWIKPKGRDNKIRRSIKGKPPLVRVGYGIPKQLRGKNKEGFDEVVIHNINDLEKLNPKKQIAVIAKRVGLKNKYKIAEYAKKIKITIANIPTRVQKINEKKKQKTLDKDKKQYQAKEAKEETQTTKSKELKTNEK
ncbi:MAG: 50S ribosomal protein L32e [Candidatus Aenigmarchaeota archaeon ex4484_52]|nr:MAG: 50S ribosomal protein L32e [Candidatus Aenigmarchaeota archaeon ex4484_52]